MRFRVDTLIRKHGYNVENNRVEVLMLMLKARRVEERINNVHTPNGLVTLLCKNQTDIKYSAWHFYSFPQNRVCAFKALAVIVVST